MNDTWLVAIAVNSGCRRLFSGGKINGHALHRELMRLAPAGLGDEARREAGLLYRVEQVVAPRQGLRILAQLTLEPDVRALASEFAAQVQQRRLNPLLSRLTTGARVRYRIDANATKRHGNAAEPHKRGKLANLHGTEAELWWLRKSTEVGLHPLQLTSTPQPDVLGRASKRNKDKNPGDEESYTAVHGVTRFDGIGVVTDPDRLRAAVNVGIGRARNYGCGLLSLALTEEAP
ncbi:type I-E CRISPR-associated protein Cas6/Cse3/CasE [Saccharopolyspora sp. MS10]|uniref:type I-E CRISPR-associated protein Cas6/Cse3/CasE n=1 Tax=Saccharopolyspora sp. MS10 TaxID=3385973 RepID=UPI0039A176E9